MTHKWNYLPITSDQAEASQRLAQELGISPVLGRLLVERGITTATAAKKFFRPQLPDLYDPFLMKDMDVAVERLNKAMGKKERILIYGDYEVDSFLLVFIRQRLVLAVSMLQVADTTFGTVGVQFLIISILRTECQIKLSGSGTGIFPDRLLTDVRAGDAIPVYLLGQRHSVYAAYGRVHQSAFGKFAPF